MEFIAEIKNEVDVSYYIFINYKKIFLYIKFLESKINFKYDDQGILRNKKDNSKLPKVSKEEYDLISQYSSKYILYNLIKKQELLPIYIPFNSENYFEKDSSLAQCIVLASKDFKTNSKCLIMIQGAGHVTLGEWANSCCVNEGLKMGSMLPFVEKAKQNGFSILIMNPNERYGLDGKNIIIFKNMKEHCIYAYENLIFKNDKIKEVYFISHSLGGECNVEILKLFEKDLLNNRIKKIAFTDGLQGGSCLSLSKEGIKKLRKISRNYIASNEVKGKFMETESYFSGCDVYSSGVNIHEYTTGNVINEIFTFFEEKN